MYYGFGTHALPSACLTVPAGMSLSLQMSVPRVSRCVRVTVHSDVDAPCFGCVKGLSLKFKLQRNQTKYLSHSSQHTSICYWLLWVSGTFTKCHN